MKADVRYLMITHMNREMEGRIGKILKDKREQTLSRAPNHKTLVDVSEKCW